MNHKTGMDMNSEATLSSIQKQMTMFQKQMKVFQKQMEVFHNSIDNLTESQEKLTASQEKLTSSFRYFKENIYNVHNYRIQKENLLKNNLITSHSNMVNEQLLVEYYRRKEYENPSLLTCDEAVKYLNQLYPVMNARKVENVVRYWAMPPEVLNGCSDINYVRNKKVTNKLCFKHTKGCVWSLCDTAPTCNYTIGTPGTFVIRT